MKSAQLLQQAVRSAASSGVSLPVFGNRVFRSSLPSSTVHSTGRGGLRRSVCNAPPSLHHFSSQSANATWRFKSASSVAFYPTPYFSSSSSPFRIQTRTMASATSFYDFKPLDKKGNEVDFADYKGKVVLIINTASKCGFTPQYAGLETVYKSVKEKHPDDFAVLGFPCNQFGGQEPGTNDDIQSFCQVNYGVSFPIMGKIDVNGDKAAPLYSWLKKEKPGIMGLQRVKWNFEKFLVGKDGAVKGRWASTTKPESLESAILAELENKA